MTLEEAKEILKTYRHPLTTEQLATFKLALSIVSSSFTKVN